MSDSDDEYRNFIEANTPSKETRDAMWNLGAAAIGFVISREEKIRLKNLEAELRTKKPKWYLFHTIVGVTCPNCNSATEEGQWCCHLCGAALT